MFGNQFSDGGYKFARDFHNRLGGIFRSGLVFRDCLFLGLFLIVRQNSLYALFILPWGEFALLHSGQP